MEKRAQGLSMTTIVVAALALLVLVVLALVFTGRMGDFSTGVKKVGTCEQACSAAGLTKSTATCTITTDGYMPGVEPICCCT